MNVKRGAKSLLDLNKKIEINGKFIKPIAELQDEYWFDYLPLFNEEVTDNHIDTILKHISFRDCMKLIEWDFLSIE